MAEESMIPPAKSGRVAGPPLNLGPPQICGAEKPGGLTCMQPAGYNTAHLGYGPCSAHFGSTARGNQRAAKEAGWELVQFYGMPKQTHPSEALMDEVRRTAGHVAWLGAQIATWEMNEENFKLGPSDALKGWLALYHAERDRLAKFSKMALDAGIQERQITLAEQTGERIAMTVSRILETLNLNDDQKRLIPMVVPSELRRMRKELFIEGEVVEPVRDPDSYRPGS